MANPPEHPLVFNFGEEKEEKKPDPLEPFWEEMNLALDMSTQAEREMDMPALVPTTAPALPPRLPRHRALGFPPELYNVADWGAWAITAQEYYPDNQARFHAFYYGGSGGGAAPVDVSVAAGHAVDMPLPVASAPEVEAARGATS